MKLETSDRHVRSTLTGERIQMQIAANAGAKLMNIMVNLYKDQQTAILREYGANGLDAHIAAGNTAPIEITIPTNRFQEPVVKIKDFGVGLSVDDIRDIYSQYGASTKDESNDFTGAFGLGCKSALSYCDSFTLVSVKDGVEVTVAVTRDDDNGGSMTVVDTRSTTDPNGVEVQIPVAYPHDFMNKAEKFFRFWDEGTVLINGNPPPTIEGLKLSDQMLLTSDNVLDSDYIVMGAVPYPTSALNLGMPYGTKLIVKVPLGVFEPIPSREALLENSDFRDGAEAIRETFDALMVDAIQAEINDAQTHIEALEVMLKWHRKVPDRLKPANGYVYKGTKLPLRMEAPANTEWFKVPGTYSKLSEKSEVQSYSAEQWSQTYWIHGFDKAGWTPTMRKKLNYYMETIHARRTSYLYGWNFLISTARISSPFIENDMRIKWADVDAVKLPRNRGVRAGDNGRIPGSYDIYEAGTPEYGVPGDDISTDLPLFYYRGKMGENMLTRERELIEGIYPDCTVVVLNANRVTKFRRLFPKAVELGTQCCTEWDKFKGTVTDGQKLTLAYQNLGYADFLRKLDPDDILDPKVQDAILYQGEDLSELRRSMTKYVNAYQGQIALPVVEFDLLDRYPLLRDGSYYSDHVRSFRKTGELEHAIGYMNYMYETKIKAEDAENESLDNSDDM